MPSPASPWTPRAPNDIIYHELTHAVIYGFGILPSGPNREAAALHEGVADYFAAALTGDPAIGEWLYLRFPNGCTRVDQPAATWNYRNYDRVGFGGGDISSAWGNGMILSSALWDLRQDIGNAADSLVLESFTYLPSTPIWSQFANALLQADQDHHGSRFASAIVRHLLDHGIHGIGGSAFAGITGPSTLAPGIEGEFRAQPCCNVPLETYRWRVREWCRGAPCGDWSDAGSVPVLRLAFDNDSELELRAMSPWTDTVFVSHFVGVRPPELVVEGPRRVPRQRNGTWRARVAAMGPVHVSWMRQSRRRGAPVEQLGGDLEQSFAPDTSLRPDRRRSSMDWIAAWCSASRWRRSRIAPPVSTGVERLSQRLDAGAQHAETTFELTRASAAHAGGVRRARSPARDAVGWAGLARRARPALGHGRARARGVLPAHGR